MNTLTGNEPSYDFFVSYADADCAWVEGYLIDALHAAGVRTLHEAAFQLGAPRLDEFERAVKQSRRTLLILTPAWLSDGHAEFVGLLAATFGLETSTWPLIPLLLHPVSQLPTRLSILTALDATDATTWPVVVQRLCAEAGKPAPTLSTSRPESRQHATWQRMLQNYRDSLRLIEEREAEYVLQIDIPLQLLREKERLLAKIAELEAKVNPL